MSQGISGRAEHLGRRAGLDQLAHPVIAHKHHSHVVGHPSGLEHVVGYKHYRDIPGQAGDELLDLGRGNGVESRAGLVHEEHLGLDRQRPGDAQALLLAARQLQGRLAQPVLHQVPEGGLAKSLLCRLPQL